MLALLALVLASSRGTQPMMRWDVSVELDSTTILERTTIEAHPGRLLAVLGPSGAGKSTLLGVLAGRSSLHRRMRLSGSASSAPDAHDVSTLDQAEHFFGLLTVRETLELASELEGTPPSSVHTEVDALLQSLGLTAVQHSRVGDAIHRGISGGEKRRLAVGCALCAHPILLVADEPTTGLDSHQAARVVRLVRDAAVARGIPAVATLHQPRSSIWATLDDVLLLAPHGRVVYSGPRAGTLSHFAKLGYRCPSHVNPAEHLIDLVSIDHDSPDGAAIDELRIRRLADAWARRTSPAAAQATDGVAADSRPADAARTPKATAVAGTAAAAAAAAGGPRRQRPRLLRRLGLLVRRSWRQNIRDGWVNGLRLGVRACVRG